MAFSTDVANEALVGCARRCCICRKFCGSKIELHHIIPEADGGADTLGNCIPLCFDCHAEVGSYNSRHPKGKKYSDEELIRHRDIWFEFVCNHPERLNNSPESLFTTNQRPPRGPITSSQVDMFCEQLRQVHIANVSLMAVPWDREAIHFAESLKVIFVSMQWPVEGVWRDAPMNWAGPGMLVRCNPKVNSVGLPLADALKIIRSDCLLVQNEKFPIDPIEIVVGPWE